VNRLDAIRSLVVFAQEIPTHADTVISVENLALLLETAAAADALMDARNVAPVIPLGYWGELGRCLRKLTAEEES